MPAGVKGACVLCAIALYMHLNTFSGSRGKGFPIVREIIISASITPTNDHVSLSFCSYISFHSDESSYAFYRFTHLCTSLSLSLFLMRKWPNRRLLGVRNVVLLSFKLLLFFCSSFLSFSFLCYFLFDIFISF